MVYNLQMNESAGCEFLSVLLSHKVWEGNYGA